MNIFDEFLNGNYRALAKLISQVESFNKEGFKLLEKLEEYYNLNKINYKASKKQIIIGITGPPGSGKSSLVDKLARAIISNDSTNSIKVGIVAFDPSSPFTGGAILGDRVRMGSFVSPNLFFRSMGTRGSLGGMSKAISFVLKAYELFGFDYIIIETVGIGQLEIDVVKMADTTIVVEVPGLGDEIQAIKAGIFEIGDIFVINKIDKSGVEKIFCEINYMLSLRKEKMLINGINYKWEVPIVKTNCINGEGIDELLKQIIKHKSFIYENNIIYENDKKRRKEQYLSFIRDFIEEKLVKKLHLNNEFEKLILSSNLNIISTNNINLSLKNILKNQINNLLLEIDNF